MMIFHKIGPLCLASQLRPLECRRLCHITAAASEDACHKRHRYADQHNSGDNVEGRCVIRVLGGAKAGDQNGANDPARAPCRQHCTVNCTGILWTEEVSRECWHRAKSTTVTESDDGCWNE